MSRGQYRWNSSELADFLDRKDLTPEEFSKLVKKTPRLIQYVLTGKTVTTRLGTLRAAKESFPAAGYDASEISKIFTKRRK